MKIYNLNVNGELTLNSKFDGKNILLGENNTGKSTFVKLLLYALGVNINNFIEEIAKELELEVGGKMPIDPVLAAAADKGEFACVKNPYLETAVEILRKM